LSLTGNENLEKDFGMEGEVPNIFRENQKQRALRAAEWRKFRRDYLFSQQELGEALGISRRSVQKVEAGESTPLPRTQRAFRDLKKAEAERLA
jgi:DNA-binding XRE family transcriptional regulator